MLSFIPYARWVIGHFPVPKTLTFKMSLSCKNEFYLHENEK